MVGKTYRFVCTMILAIMISLFFVSIAGIAEIMWDDDVWDEEMMDDEEEIPITDWYEPDQHATSSDASRSDAAGRRTWPDATHSDATISDATMSNAIIAATPSNALLELMSGEVVVTDYDELAQAITDTSVEVHTIYFGADITADRREILIPKERKGLVIDGTYNGERYKFTTCDSTSISNGISIKDPEVDTVTMKNIDVDVFNYYGPIGVYHPTIGVTVEYDNVVHYGKQICHNPSGTIIFRNVVSESVNLGASYSEFAEATRIEIYETLVVNHQTTEEVFGFNYNYASDKTEAMILYEDAEVTITAAGQTRGLLEATDTSPVYMELKRGAKFTYIANGVDVTGSGNSEIQNLTLGDYAEWNIILNSQSRSLSKPINLTGQVNIARHAALNITVNGNSGGSLIGYGNTSGFDCSLQGTLMINCQGNLTDALYLGTGVLVIGKDGALIMDSISNSGTHYLRAAGIDVNEGELNLSSGASSSTYFIRATGNVNFNSGSTVHLFNRGSTSRTALIRVQGTGVGVSVNNPKSLILYDANTRLLHYQRVGDWNMTASQINLWYTGNDPVSGSFEGLPERRWIMGDGSDVRVQGSLAATTGNYTVSDTNYNGSEESPAEAMMTMSMRVLAMGELMLEVDDYHLDDIHLTGVTEPEATVRLTAGGQTYEAIAGHGGHFQFSLTGLSEQDDLIVEVNKNYLYQRKETKALPGGVLKFLDIPDTMQFRTTAIPTQIKRVYRAEDDWRLQIEDSRRVKEPWAVSVRLVKPLTPDTSIPLPILDQALIYIDGGGQKHYLDQTDPVRVFDEDNGTALTDVMWPGTQGILLEITPGAIYKDIDYLAEIEWILEDAP